MRMRRQTLRFMRIVFTMLLHNTHLIQLLVKACAVLLFGADHFLLRMRSDHRFYKGCGQITAILSRYLCHLSVTTQYAYALLPCRWR